MTLVLVTAIGVIAGILAMSMIDLGYHARILSVRNVERMSARTAADAGLADAVFRMQRNLITSTYFDGVALPHAEDVPLSGTTATYSYTITKLDVNHHYRIDATGKMAGQTKTVHAILRVGSRLEDVGTIERLESKSDIRPEPDTYHTAVRCNNGDTDSIEFFPNTVIYADVASAPGTDPTKVINTISSATITGDTYASEDELVFPPVAAPTPALGAPAITGDLTMSTGGTYQVPKIDLPNGKHLVIDAPNATVKLYVSGTTILKKDAGITVANGSRLELYLGGNMTMDNSADGLTNLTLDPSSLKIYGLPTCTQIDLKAKSTLYAGVYAPSARVDIYNNGDFHGGVCANELYIKNNGRFYISQSVVKVMVDDPDAVFKTQRWWED